MRKWKASHHHWITYSWDTTAHIKMYIYENNSTSGFMCLSHTLHSIMYLCSMYTKCVTIENKSDCDSKRMRRKKWMNEKRDLFIQCESQSIKKMEIFYFIIFISSSCFSSSFLVNWGEKKLCGGWGNRKEIEERKINDVWKTRKFFKCHSYSHVSELLNAIEKCYVIGDKITISMSVGFFFQIHNVENRINIQQFLILFIKLTFFSPIMNVIRKGEKRLL